MSEPLLVTERRPDGSAWITLDRPVVHNAFDELLIAELTAALCGLAGAYNGKPYTKVRHVTTLSFVRP